MLHVTADGVMVVACLSRTQSMRWNENVLLTFQISQTCDCHSRLTQGVTKGDDAIGGLPLLADHCDGGGGVRELSQSKSLPSRIILR